MWWTNHRGRKNPTASPVYAVEVWKGEIWKPEGRREAFRASTSWSITVSPHQRYMYHLKANSLVLTRCVNFKVYPNACWGPCLLEVRHPGQWPFPYAIVRLPKNTAMPATAVFQQRLASVQSYWEQIHIDLCFSVVSFLGHPPCVVCVVLRAS